MSEEEFKNKCKQRFKGVENFLRRVAFNLGNSPSQTEVKIISCIPIDVTDLQKKIISLEKQLDDAKKIPTNATVAAAHQECRAELTATHKLTSSYEVNELDQSTEPIKENEQCRSKRSRLSCVYPVTAMTNKKIFATNEPNKNINVYCNFAENKKDVFKKVKKKKDLKKNDNPKTQLVYYAQTTNTPFNDYYANMKSGFRDNRNNKRLLYQEQMIYGKYEPRPRFNLDNFTNETDFPAQARGINNRNDYVRDDNRSYLEHMIRRQYEPRPIFDEFSDGSTFSSPICRDNEQNHNVPQDFDSCSCCHGAFHNIDILDSPDNLLPTHIFNNNNSERSIFYDTSLYDMVPVKEISTTIRKNGGHSKRKQKKTELNIMYPPETKAKTNNNSLVVNYHTLAPTKLKSTKISPKTVTHKMKTRKIAPRLHVATKTSVEPIEADTSQSCCIDFGNVYVKQVHKKFTPPKTVQTKKQLVLLKNAECLATNVLNTECQTMATQSIEIDDNKTEKTLNQIKSILQSVLTEVKTNAQLKHSPHDKDTKDAIVQKDGSRGNMVGCSDLLHSYTYSTCNINPCHRQLSSGRYCSSLLPYNPMKCMHNFPVFIQTPNRNLCASCYRNTSNLAKGYPRPAITAATNTENDKEEHNKETEKLIKEIYKSIALNLDVPAKDTSISENCELQSDRTSINNSRRGTNKLSHSTGVTIKSIPQMNMSLERHMPINSSLTPFSTNTFTSNLKSNTISMQSQVASTTDTDRHLRNDRIEKFVQNKKSRRSMRSVREEYEQPSDNAVISEYTEQSDEESDQDAGDQQPTKNNNKENIFTKMFKSVKLFKNKHKQEQTEHISQFEEEEEDNDSDYQTIYSQKIDRVRYLPTKNRTRKLPHSKISYSRQMRDRYPEKKMPYMDQEYRRQCPEQKKVPYMDQEYRRQWPEQKKVPYMDQEYKRQWAEQLMFRDNQLKNFPQEPPYSRDGSKRRDRQTFYQNYETRNVIIEQDEPASHSNEDHTSGTPYRESNSGTKYVNVPRKAAVKGLTWLKKHKLGIHCGEQWKKIILEG